MCAVLSVNCLFCVLLVQNFKSMHTDVLNMVQSEVRKSNISNIEALSD